jgi:UDP-N-acetylmuramoyl-L-alanyl-D-glutamate--2,6-diaminopimelate ligase
MLLGDLLRSIPEAGIRGVPRVPVTGITYDSRRVRAGNLFVGIRGEKTNGVRFFRDAVRGGAVALVSEEESERIPGVVTMKVNDARRFLARAALAFYLDPPSRLKLVGITGTNGKTTTSFLVDAIYREAGLYSCLAGTTGMRIGNDWRSTDRTTPEAPDLMFFLHEAAVMGCSHGVMEVSSHALELKRVFGVRCAVGVFTNLTQDHLDFHHDMESYYRAKKILFLPEGENRVETAVINTDDPYGRRLASEISCRVVRFGFEPGSEIRAIDCRFGAEGTDMVIGSPMGEIRLRSRLVGRPNAYNVLAAAGAALSVGFDAEAIRRGIESLEGVAGRMERVDAGQPYLVIVDYAHTPDALAKLLETVRSLPHKRLTTVFGCGGDRDRTKRPIMGEIAARMSDRVIATSDNPRSEDPLEILLEIEPGLKKGPAGYEMLADRRAAIAAALTGAGEGDAVVIAGKGHEAYQVIGSQVLPFDDRAVARELILNLINRAKQ